MEASQEAFFGLVPHARVRTFVPGATVQTQGGSWQSLYYVISGSLSALQENEEGRVAKVHEYPQRAVAGVDGYFARSTPAPTLLASGEVSLAKVSYQHLDGILAQATPDVRDRVSKGLVKELTDQTLRYHRLLTSLLSVSLVEKVYGAAHSLATLRGELAENGQSWRLKAHRYEIAQMVGCSIQAAQLNLQKLVAQDRIRLEAKSVMILPVSA